MMPLRVHSATHPGLHHPRNEDTHTVLPTGDGGLLLAVCDGMGGMGRADEASRLAIEVLSGAVVHTAGAPTDRLRAALRAADIRVRDELCTGPNDRPGATAVLVLVHGGAAHVAWVGDSRAYLVRGGQVVARTRDHKLVEDLVEAGQLTPEEARNSPLSHVVTRALGGRSSSDAPVQAAAFGYPWPLHPGDHLVLCSDGVSDLIDDRELAALASHGAPAHIVDRLVETSLMRGGHDNITVIVAEWGAEQAADAGTPPSLPPRAAAPRAVALRAASSRAEAPPLPASHHSPSGHASSPDRAWLTAGGALVVLAAIAAIASVSY